MPAIQLSPAIPQLPSGDIQLTADFFKTALGFEVAAIFPEHKHLIVRREAAEIHFWQADTEELARHYGEASSCYIRVTGIEGLYQELQARGAKFRYGLTKQPWGMNEMQIDDPYGNAIRFGEVVE
ncbi:MAG: VOC family protein [Proteobacteria bacterium]|nr:VOC family protein [Pseudomonadota bacterium]